MSNSSPHIRKEPDDSVENEKDMKKLKTDKDDSELSDRDFFDIWCKSRRRKYFYAEAEKLGFEAFKTNLDREPTAIQKERGMHLPGFADRLLEDLDELHPHSYAFVSRSELLEYRKSDEYGRECPPDVEDVKDPNLLLPYDTLVEQDFNGWCETRGVTISDPEEKVRALNHFKKHHKRGINFTTFRPWSWN